MFRLEQRKPRAQQPVMQSVQSVVNWLKLAVSSCINTFSKWEYDILVCFSEHEALNQILGYGTTSQRAFFPLHFKTHSIIGLIFFSNGIMKISRCCFEQKKYCHVVACLHQSHDLNFASASFKMKSMSEIPLHCKNIIYKNIDLPQGIKC